MLGCLDGPLTREGGVSGASSDSGAGPAANEAGADSKARAKSIGEVASPLLAGFSFTNVIVIAMSSDTGHFLLPGEAIISWTIASIAFILAVQFAKHAADGEVRFKKWTELPYHVGVVTFLLGFGLALLTHPSDETYVFRLVASSVAFAACLVEAVVYVRRALRDRQKRPAITAPAQSDPGIGSGGAAGTA
jgi:hypothetical protein